jgi:hypothetical protein
MFEENDFVMLINPRFPELKGLAKIVDKRTSKVVEIEFCDDKSKFIAHIDFIRLATEQEKIEETKND